MNFTQFNELLLSVILGIVQGLTGVLPIGGDAHIRLVSSILLNGRDVRELSLSAIGIGTTLGLVQFFWKKIIVYAKRIQIICTDVNERRVFLENFRGWWSSRRVTNNTVDIQLAQLATALLPISIISLITGNLATNSRSVRDIALFLLAGSGLMIIAEYLKTYIKRLGEVERETEVFLPVEVVLVGLFQSLGVFPGISGLGAGICAGLLVGKQRKVAVYFSLLIFTVTGLWNTLVTLVQIIVSVFSNSYTLFPNSQSWSTTAFNNRISISLVGCFLGLFCSYLVTWITTNIVDQYLIRKNLQNIIIYRLILGVGLLVWIASPFSK